MTYLGEFEERLSTVPRWGIVRTIQRQSVAEHSFRVALIAPRIAVNWFKLPPHEMYYLQRYALLHDQYEAFSGDIPAPAKLWWQEASHTRNRVEHVIEDAWASPTIKDIVKMADLYEALVFLFVDKSLGNKTLDRVISDVVYSLIKVTDKHDGRIATALLDEARAFAYRDQNPLENDRGEVGESPDRGVAASD